MPSWIAATSTAVAISTAGAIQASNYSFETIRLPSLEFVAACRLERGEVHVAISTAGAIQASNYST